MKKLNKKLSITCAIILIIIIIVVIIREHSSQPHKLNNITSVRVEYNQRIAKILSLDSQIEIKNVEQIDKLVECFNVKSSYERGCDCPSHDIIIYFISDKKDFVYNIGITGDVRIQYSEVPDKDIVGIDIDDIIEILKQNPGSENLKYPID